MNQAKRTIENARQDILVSGATATTPLGGSLNLSDRKISDQDNAAVPRQPSKGTVSTGHFDEGDPFEDAEEDRFEDAPVQSIQDDELYDGGILGSAANRASSKMIKTDTLNSFIHGEKYNDVEEKHHQHSFENDLVDDTGFHRRATNRFIHGQFDDFDSDEDGDDKEVELDDTLYDDADVSSVASACSVLTQDSTTRLLLSSSSSAAQPSRLPNTTLSGDDGVYSKFFLSKPVSQSEVDATSESIYTNMNEVLCKLEEGGTKAYNQLVLEQQTSPVDDENRSDTALYDENGVKICKNKRIQEQQEALEAALIRGSPRDYQTALFEIAKTRNTIVHLGTGKGKTLIALLCIQYFASLGAVMPTTPVEKLPISLNQNKQQTLFLVPSVALALQQSTTLRANLPFTVQTACSFRADRLALSEADILVATHGAMYDLLMHYGDLFSLQRYALVVFDECHYAHSNHQYKLIMDRWYHTIPVQEKRPHILGLTASPLINVKSNHTDEQLSRMLRTLEQTLDSSLVTLRGIARNDTANTVDCENPISFSTELLHQEASEKQVYYFGDPEPADFPDHGDLKIHPRRSRELNQLRILYQDLGPFPVSLYCKSVMKEVSCNVYEKETAVQFRCLLQHLLNIIRYCEEKTERCPHGGRSDKLIKLEECLSIQVAGHEEEVGLVFVQRRITAMTLYVYFSRSKEGAVTSSAGPSVASTEPSSSSDSAGTKSSNELLLTGKLRWVMPAQQFEDAEEDLASGNFDVITSNRRYVIDDDDDATYFTSTSSMSKSTHSSSSTKSSINSSMTNDFTKAKIQPTQKLACQFEDAEDDAATGFFELASTKQRNEMDNNLSVDTETKRTTVHFELERRGYNEVGDEAFVVANQERSSSVQGTAVQKSPAAGSPFLQDQFHDADDATVCTADISTPAKETRNIIRCGALVRQATHIFKYLNASNHIALDDQEDADSDQEWLHQEIKIRETLNALRKKEINVLLATSIVEEGVDVQACSFVVVFDTVNCTKAYIQMKGRARQKDAKFFLFQDTHDWKKSDLSRLQEAEKRVHSFIEAREDKYVSEIAISKSFARLESNPSLSDELQAVEEHFYQAMHGQVDLKSAKSLLNRYVLNIPIEATARATKESFLLHMPTFKDYELVLPSHLPIDVRVVTLPQQYHSLLRGERQQIMALMACVRLHKLKLLNERMLPLGKKDLTREILRVGTNQIGFKTPYASSICSLFAGGKRQVFLYPIVQKGKGLSACQNILKGHNQSITLISCKKITQKVDCVNYNHSQLGGIHCELGAEQLIILNELQWSICSSFFCCLFNARWRRKTEGEEFQGRQRTQRQEVVSPYVVGLLKTQGQLDWDAMKKIIADCNRPSYEIENAARSYDTMCPLSAPRLCNPTYHLNAAYIILGPSSLDCSAPFPDNSNEKVLTFQDYYRIKYCCDVPRHDRLFFAQRLWDQPSQYQQDEQQNIDPFPSGSNCDVSFDIPNGVETCAGLATVLLPHSVCLEATFADPALLLLSVLLPQVLYAVERTLTVQSFMRHCRANFPSLGTFLEQIPWSQLCTAMTAKSANLNVNYDKFEWLGDAVLKLLQSDALLHTPELHRWVAHLHEGDLTTLRSALGSNQYLATACRRIGFDKFVFLAQLSRGKWLPQSLVLCPRDGEILVDRVESQTSMKVCADFMESLLGLIHIHFGYEAARAVGFECGLLLPQGMNTEEFTRITVTPRCQLYTSAQHITGRSFQWPGLIEEAFTHPSAVHEEVPSYQRLEWVGDAVLCIAIREWIFQKYPDMSVGDMVTLDAALVSNEVLGFQCFKAGLHKFINHREQSLPARLEHYEWTIQELGRGIWGSEPPKILPDVVEALLGAAHIDGGYEAGFLAVNTLMGPILAAVESLDKNSRKLYHPITKMNHMAGRLLHVDVQHEDSFLREHGRDNLVWQGNRWREGRIEGTESVGTVKVLGKNIISVIEPTWKSARNRACALTVAVLEKNPDLVQRWQAITTEIDRYKTNILLKQNGIERTGKGNDQVG